LPFPAFSFIVPTRGRPEGLRRLIDSLRSTATDPDCFELIAVVDEDDEGSRSFHHPHPSFRCVVTPPGLAMGELNLAGYAVSQAPLVMLLNDDVVVRSDGWDVILRSAAARFPDGMVLLHTNDLLFGPTLCTFPLLPREFCELAGGVCEASYHRYRIDDHIHHVFDLLRVLGYSRRVYLPEVVFEHLNKVEADGQPAAYVPNPEIHAADTRRFEQLTEARQRLALACAERIEAARSGARHGDRRRLLQEAPEAIELRRPEHARVYRTEDPVAGARVEAVILTNDARAFRACADAVEATSPGFPIRSCPDAGAAAAESTADFLLLIDPAFRPTPGWWPDGAACIREGANAVLGEGVRLLEMSVCQGRHHPDALTQAGVVTAAWPEKNLRSLAPQTSPAPPTAEPVAPVRIPWSTRLTTTAKHWLTRVPPPLFDAAWYRRENPDVARAGADPWRHYLKHGAFEGRNPNPHFDSAFYLRAHPDVAASGMNPLVHYVRDGAREGRNPHPLFDTRRYLREHPEAAGNPLEHFLRHGQPLARDVPPLAAPAIRTTNVAREPGCAAISVVMPTYNRADRLAMTLDRCRRLSEGLEIELVVVDDGSKDATPALLAEAEKRIPGLRWTSIANRGPANARNVGASMARHPVILFVGDDVYPRDRDFFLVHARMHQEDPATDLAVIGQVDWERETSRPTFAMECFQADGAQFDFRRLNAGEPPSWLHFYTANLSLKRARVADWMAGGFDSGFPIAAFEDVELGYRLSSTRPGLTIRYAPESMGVHDHFYTLGTFLDRQLRLGASLDRLLNLHPDLAGYFQIVAVQSALQGSESVTADVAAQRRFLADARARARWMEAAGELGADPRHRDLVNALAEAALAESYVLQYPQANQAAALAVVVDRLAGRAGDALALNTTSSCPC
jgi:glycosyltransferase involved in cell wall biosynthesis